MSTESDLSRARNVVAQAQNAYREHGGLDELDLVIAATEALVSVASHDQADHGMAVMQLADLLATRWAQTGDEATWDRGVRLVEAWMKRVPPPDWRAALYLLANGLLRYRRAKVTGDAASVTAAISALETAKAEARVGSGVHGTASARLGDLRLDEFDAERDPLELERGIQNAIDVIGSDRALEYDRYVAARTLGRGLLRRHEVVGGGQLLQGALEAARHAMTIAPTSFDAGDIEGLLATILRARFQSGGNPDDLDEAIASYERSLQLVNEAEPDVKARRMDNLGNGFMARYELASNPGDLDDAIACSQRALELYSSDTVGRRRTLVNLGTSLTALAVDRADQAALLAACETFRQGLDLPAGDDDVGSRLHAGYGSALLIRHAIDEAAERPDMAMLDHAIDHLERAVDAILHAVAIKPVLYRLGNLSVAEAVSRRLSGALLSRAEHIDNGSAADGDRSRALAIAEASKSPLLIEELLRRTLSAPSGVESGLVDWEAQLLAELSALDAWELVPMEGTTPSRRLRRMDQRRRAYLALERVWDEIEATGAQGATYAALRRSPPSALLSLLAAEPHELLLALLETEVADADGRFRDWLVAMVWAPGAGSPRPLFQLDHDPIPEAVRQFADQVPRDRGAETCPETWWQNLAPHFVGQQGVSDGTVVVSPTFSGAAVPWSLLLERAQWGENLAVVVVPSLVLAVLPEPAPGPRWREVMDVADAMGLEGYDQDVVDSVRLTVPMPEIAAAPPVVIGDPSGNLPGASSEAIAVARILGVQPLLGPAASLRAVLTALEGSSLLHIAAHAQFDAESPMASSIHLADGDLTVGRLVGAWSSARMLVLSACEGATGTAVTGGEMLGLSAALVRTGVDSLVASLWRADDAASSFLMTSFHEQVATGMPAAQALAEAQRQTRVESGWDPAYYWAGFVVCDRGAATA